MNSSELARLAGVTVRTLRHYHRMGVLPEPPRRANGYREYGARDLVLLLRVRHLTDLGVPLARIPDVLDDTVPDTREEVLDELDADLGGRIAELTRRRGVLRRLRALDASPDLPPHLAEPLRTVARRIGVAEQSLVLERGMALLLDLLLDEKDRTLLAEYYAALAGPGPAPRHVEAMARWEALDNSSNAAECDEVAREIVEVSQQLAPSASDPDAAVGTTLPPLVEQYLEESLHPRQREVLERAMTLYAEDSAR